MIKPPLALYDLDRDAIMRKDPASSHDSDDLIAAAFQAIRRSKATLARSANYARRDRGLIGELPMDPADLSGPRATDCRERDEEEPIQQQGDPGWPHTRL